MEVTSRAIFIDKYFHPRFIGMERSFFFLFFFQKNESRERRSGRMSYIFFFFSRIANPITFEQVEQTRLRDKTVGRVNKGRPRARVNEGATRDKRSPQRSKPRLTIPRHANRSRNEHSLPFVNRSYLNASPISSLPRRIRCSLVALSIAAYFF